MWDVSERQALVEVLHEAGPGAPTLCEGWQTQHLAAHLYLRRHRPWRAFDERDGSVFAALAEQASTPGPYERLVERFAAEPRGWTPMALMDGPLGRWTNLMEYVIHHEDVRRGDGDTTARRLPGDLSDAIFDGAVTFARMAMRSFPVGVVLVVPGGRRRVVRKDRESVAVVGGPTDLALVASGRRRAADVELLGSEDAVAAFSAAAS